MLLPAISSTLDQAQKTLVAIEGTLGKDSPLQHEMTQALKELAEAARALRILADYLERHPDAHYFRERKSTMMRITIFKKGFLMVLFIAVLFAGCRSSAPTGRILHLKSQPTRRRRRPISPVPIKRFPSVSVPVEIPNILDRPQIVTRIGPNKLKIDEFHRWAGRLEEDFAQGPGAKHLCFAGHRSGGCLSLGNRTFKPHYRIALDIRYFEGSIGVKMLF